MDVHATIPVTQTPTGSLTGGATAHGWHQDRLDPTTARYWDGGRWTATRRWDGAAWVDADRATTWSPTTSPLGAQAAAGVESATAMVRSLAESVPAAALAFKVFVGAAVAMVLGYFVPVATVSGELGTTETRTLGDVGGFGVLVLAAAAATVWLAWPARRGRLSIGAMAGLGAVAGVVRLFVLVVLSAMGTTETDLGMGMVATSTASPSLGIVFLVLGVGAQGVGLALAVLDRIRPTV